MNLFFFYFFFSNTRNAHDLRILIQTHQLHAGGNSSNLADILNTQADDDTTIGDQHQILVFGHDLKAYYLTGLGG